MEIIHNGEYDDTYYQARALATLKKTGDGSWDYSDSLLLYMPGDDVEYEAAQSPEKDYAKLITEPEREYLAAIAPSIAQELPDTFEYIDLGPGTAHKEQPLFDEFAKLGKQFMYRPVDISKHYLAMADRYASAQKIPVEPILGPFEELPRLLGPVKAPRFVSLGLTYVNYGPLEILTILKGIAGPNGKVFINAQIRERANMAAITNVYAADAAAGMSNAKLKVIGIDPETDISEIDCDDGVKTWVTVKNVPSNLVAMGMKPGDRLLTFQSLRPSLTEFQTDIAKVFENYKLLDIGQGFVGALLG